MTKYLKTKNFNIKPKVLNFTSVNHMTDLDKKKIYINFVKFLNNHFKGTLFKKNLYDHFHLHCGFIAHYNIKGFYGEYFETAASFHYNVNGYTNPMNEYAGNLNVKSNLSHGEQFFKMFEELQSNHGIGEFIQTIESNNNWGAYSDYSDLDNAIKDAIREYKQTWVDLINEAYNAEEKANKIEAKKKVIEESLNIFICDIPKNKDTKVTHVKSAENKDLPNYLEKYSDDEVIALFKEYKNFNSFVDFGNAHGLKDEVAKAIVLKGQSLTKNGLVDKTPQTLGQTSLFDFFDVA